MSQKNPYRQMKEKSEKDYLSPFSAFSKDHQRVRPIKEDYRPPYKRDTDAILHSKAYSRYGDKTQVAYLIDNDHITHRNLHVQHVSSFSRGIAQVLRLNSDLVEAIALGHDVGHPPFGHEGEGYLSDLSQEFGNGPFSHPQQACRLFSEIENLNLCLAVYDGFLCHDGGMSGTIMKPNYGKTWESHLNERILKKEHPERNIFPATLEGCLVKLCDTISYLAKDLEDAIQLGLIERNQIPKTTLGITNSEILSTLASDIIEHSHDKDVIALSSEAYETLKILRQFNFKHIYIHPKLKTESSKIKRGYRLLFEWLLHDLKQKEMESYLWQNTLHKRDDGYLRTTNPVQMVIDYISGMTDTFFVRTLNKILLPQKIELSPCKP